VSIRKNYVYNSIKWKLEGIVVLVKEDFDKIREFLMLLGIEGFKKTVLLMTNLNFSTNAGHNNCASICDSHYFSIEIPYAKIHGTSFVKFQGIEITPSKNFIFRGILKSLS
jgi:hypothetical protein